MSSDRPLRVFISYSHDSEEHTERVLDLADQLRVDGIDAWIDQYETAPARGWPLWMEEQVKLADFVLCVCTATYRRRFDQEETPGIGLGVTWEAALVRLGLFVAQGENRKFLPILFDPGAVDHIPDSLHGFHYFHPTNAQGYEQLYRHLTGQPNTTAPPLGKRRTLPQRPHRPLFHDSLAEPVQDVAQPRGSSSFKTLGVGRRSPEPYTEPVTGAVFLPVPGGTFTMGNPIEACRVRLSPFWLARTPVTNEQYGRFLAATGREEPPTWRDRRFSASEQPVVSVTWEDATTYCQWLSKDHPEGHVFQLPSEAQWEFAARGPESRTYPWGNDPPTSTRACYGLDSSQGKPATVGSYPEGAGPFGHLDLAGLVWEWCRDAWEPHLSRWAAGEPLDPVGEGDSKLRPLRGGCWFFFAGYLRSAFRHWLRPEFRYGFVGFRLLWAPSSLTS